MGWIVHADDALLVVNKPAGLLSVPGRGADKQDCAWHRVQAQWPRAGVVHRLDMATSGLLVFALGLDAQRTLSAAFEQRRVTKRYLAWVAGQPDADGGLIDLPLAADWPNRPRQAVDQVNGRPSQTRWRVLRRAPSGHALLELQPLTGRSHQLRVHLLAMGWPILGDSLYGAPPAARLMLHAAELELPHPADGQACHWRCEPDDLFPLHDPCANASNSPRPIAC